MLFYIFHNLFMFSIMSIWLIIASIQIIYGLCTQIYKMNKNEFKNKIVRIQENKKGKEVEEVKALRALAAHRHTVMGGARVSVACDTPPPQRHGIACDTRGVSPRVAVHIIKIFFLFFLFFLKVNI